MTAHETFGGQVRLMATGLMTRRRFLVATGGATAGLITGGWIVGQAVSDVKPAPTNSTKLTVRAPARLPLLLNPNRANEIDVTLPLADLGGIAYTTILPLNLSSRSNGGWTRTVRFTQPLVGGSVDPGLHNVIGSVTRWGASGTGSSDILTLSSPDGSYWTLLESASAARTAPHSIAEGSSLNGSDPMSLPAPILVWTAKDASRSSAGSAVSPGGRIGLDFSGSGNDLIVNPGGTVRLTPTAGGVMSALSSGPSGMGCAFACGPVTGWTVVVAWMPDPAGAGTYFAVRPSTINESGVPVSSSNDLSNFIGWAAAQTDSNTSSPPIVLSVSVDASGGPPQAIVRQGPGPMIAAPPAGNQLPPSIAGIDLPSSFPIVGVFAFATQLSPDQVDSAMTRLQTVAA